MKFQSRKFRTARYVAEPRDSVSEPGRPTRKIQGVAADFIKFEWDSRLAQKALRWTDDQRMLMESTLILSDDFMRRPSTLVNSILIIPEGARVNVMVDVYDELEAYYPGLRDIVREKLGLAPGAEVSSDKCTAIITTDPDNPRGCLRDATVDSWCAQHAKMQNPDLTSNELLALQNADDSESVFA